MVEQEVHVQRIQQDLEGIVHEPKDARGPRLAPDPREREEGDARSEAKRGEGPTASLRQEGPTASLRQEGHTASLRQEGHTVVPLDAVGDVWSRKPIFMGTVSASLRATKVRNWLSLSTPSSECDGKKNLLYESGMTLKR